MLLTAFLGGALSLALFLVASRLGQQQAQREIDRAGADRAEAIRAGFERHLSALDALRALWNASEAVERDDFQAFVRPLLDEHPGLRALEWVPRVDAPPGGTRYPVLFVEPLLGNEQALGFDLGSEPTRRTMLESAARSGEARSTPPLDLVQGGSGSGLLVALPVYRRGALPFEDAPPEQPEGFVVGVFGIERIVEDALSRLAPAAVDVFLTSGGEAGVPSFVATRPAPTRAVSSPPPELEAASPGRARHQAGFDVAQRAWRVVSAAAPGFHAAHRRPFAWFLLVAGLLLTGVIAQLMAAREGRAAELEHSHRRLVEAVAEREEAVAAARRSEERFRTMFERHSSVMLLVDHESGTIAEANPAAEKFYGYPLGKLQGMPVRELDQLPPEEITRLLDVAAREQRKYFVVPHRLFSGEVRQMEIYSTPIEYQGRRLLFAIAHDVSEREALQRKTLEASKLESLGVMAGGIAHDFNNLLTSVTGNVDLALRKAGRADPARRYLEQALQAVGRASELTRRLLAFAGRGSYEQRRVDLSALASEAARRLVPTLGDGVRVVLDPAEPAPLVEGDPAQLRQGIDSLLLNASDACAARGGEVHVRTFAESLCEEPPGTVQGAERFRPGPQAVLEVRDDGDGMDPQTRARIFDPFYSTKFVGRGLGLAALLGIVRAHRGCLTLETRPGQGSCFRVYLPAAAGDACTAAPEPVRPRARVVLVVDDDEGVREVSRSMLEAQGFEVRSASGGLEALEQFAAHGHQIDLVLLDLTMPDLSGEQVLARLRALRVDVPVLLTSGHDEREALPNGTGGPHTDFLQKPYLPVDLAARVRDLLAHCP